MRPECPSQKRPVSQIRPSLSQPQSSLVPALPHSPDSTTSAQSSASNNQLGCPLSPLYQSAATPTKLAPRDNSHHHTDPNILIIKSGRATEAISNKSQAYYQPTYKQSPLFAPQEECLKRNLEHNKASEANRAREGRTPETHKVRDPVSKLVLRKEGSDLQQKQQQDRITDTASIVTEQPPSIIHSAVDQVSKHKQSSQQRLGSSSSILLSSNSSKTTEHKLNTRNSSSHNSSSSSSSRNGSDLQMGGCSTKNGSPSGTAAGAAGGASLIRAGSLNSQPTASGTRLCRRLSNMSPTSPSPTPTDCPTSSPTKEAPGGLAATNSGSPETRLQNHRRRRLSVSESAPVNPDGVESDYRGQFKIQKKQPNAVQGGAAAGKATSYAAALIDAGIESDDGSERTTSVPSSDGENENESEIAAKPRVRAGPPVRRLSISITGIPANKKQGKFEDKKEEVCVGAYFEPSSLLELGIGYVCKKGCKPESPNQDDFFIIRMDDWGLYGVFDGHGGSGHHISNYVQKNLPQIIYDDENFIPNPMEALRRAFIQVHESLERISRSHCMYDCQLSGSTATVVLHRKAENKLYVAHVGDSRCILGRLGKGGKLEAKDLSHDHKPQNIEEKKRILAAGGSVRQQKGDVPHRVFKRNSERPGLAMSRAIGDLLANSVGVTAHPDVAEYTIEPGRDLFVVLCSDGVWEFLTSQDVAEMVYAAGIKGVQGACEAVAARSWKKWVREDPEVVDDITAEVIWLYPEALMTS